MQRLSVSAEVALDLDIAAGFQLEPLPCQEAYYLPAERLSCPQLVFAPRGGRVAPIAHLLAIEPCLGPCLFETQRRPNAKLHALMLITVFVLENPSPRAGLANPDAKTYDAVGMTVVEEFDLADACRQRKASDNVLAGKSDFHRQPGQIMGRAALLFVELQRRAKTESLPEKPPFFRHLTG